MTAAPARLRRLRWWDLDAVQAIEQAAFPDEPWSVEQWWSELAGVPQTRQYVAADLGGRLVGFAGLMIGPDAAQVLTLAVAEDARGGGVGRMLLRALLAEAARRGSPEVLLEVRAGDPVAGGLYASEGFERIAVRRGYYSGGRVDAHVLRLRHPGRVLPGPGGEGEVSWPTP